jgi:2-polyprenyl-3-methyl-5-hydroxy-6-metoxy-1,4-benzoquinol methylase
MLTNTDPAHSKLTEQSANNITPKPCINCQGSSFNKLIDSYDFDTGTKHFIVEECSNCNLARTSPSLNDTQLSPYYDNSYYGSSDKKFNAFIELWTVWSNNRLANKILKMTNISTINEKENLRVLDIGCGRGNLLKAFRRRKCDCFGVERDDFPSNSPSSDITIIKEDFLNIDFDENSFDIIIIWHVLEHLTDPVSTLNKARKILKPMGNLVIAVPNIGSLQSKLFGKHWFHLDLPRHTFHFNKEALTNMLETSNLTINWTKTGGIDQSLFGFIQSAINTMKINTPNTLYALLKTNSTNIGVTKRLAQYSVCILLTPIALLEYVLSAMLNSCASLIISGTKLPSD